MTPLDLSHLMSKTPTIIPTVGALSGDAVRHIDTMVKLKARGWWDPGEMITHRLNFSEVKRAYDMYEGGDDGVVKVVMTP